MVDMSNFVSAPDAFLDRAKRVADMSPEALSRREELGSQLYFSKVPIIVSSLQKMIRLVGAPSEVLVPNTVWREAADNLSLFVKQVQEVQKFSPSGSNPSIERDQIEGGLENIYRDVFVPLSLIISATNISSLSGEIDRHLLEMQNSWSKRMDDSDAESREKIDQIYRHLTNELNSNIDAARESADSIKLLLEETRNRAAEVVTSKEAMHFANASAEFKDSASRWLVAVIVSTICLISLAVIAIIVAFSGAYQSMDASSSVQVGISKLFLFGVFGYVTAQSAKNFFAAKHNEAVNKHRQNAILAYRALVEATGSPEHRDVVLTHAAAAVFSPQDTAYVRSSSPAGDLPPTFINSITKAMQPAP